MSNIDIPGPDRAADYMASTREQYYDFQESIEARITSNRAAVTPEPIGREKKPTLVEAKKELRFDCSDDLMFLKALGACAGMGHDLFYTDDKEGHQKALKICDGCNVKDDCLEYAMANHEDYGIWGGLTEKERRNLRRNARIALTGA